MDKYREEQDPETQLSILHYNNSLSICIPDMNILSWLVAEKVWQIFSVQIVEKKKNDQKYKDEYKPGPRFSIPRYNKPLSIGIPNLKVLCLAVTEKSATQNLQKALRNPDGQTDEQTDGQR